MLSCRSACEQIELSARDQPVSRRERKPPHVHVTNIVTHTQFPISYRLRNIYDARKQGPDRSNSETVVSCHGQPHSCNYRRSFPGRFALHE